MSTYDPRSWGADCDKCSLNGNTVVPPTGPLDAKLVLVGDAPGPYDVSTGRAFSGPAGIKLDELLYAVRNSPDKALFGDIKREKVRLTSALLCRPENKGKLVKKKWDLNEYMANWRKQNTALKKMGVPPVKSPFECCKPRLMNELMISEGASAASGAPNGVVVMPLGNWALQVLTESEGKKGKASITKYRGSILPVNVGQP